MGIEPDVVRFDCKMPATDSGHSNSNRRSLRDLLHTSVRCRLREGTLNLGGAFGPRSNGFTWRFDGWGRGSVLPCFDPLGRSDDRLRSGDRLGGRNHHGAWEGSAQRMVRLVLNRHIAEVGCRVGALDAPVVRRPSFKPSVLYVNALPAVFLDNPTRVVGAIENPSDSVLLILSWILEELGPTMFPKDAIKMGIRSVDFNDDHVARAWLVKNCEKSVLVDAARHPACKILSILWQLHIAGSADGIWMYDA
jgi:hypothetical protein